jgi:hypothetical protein
MNPNKFESYILDPQFNLMFTFTVVFASIGLLLLGMVPSAVISNGLLGQGKSEENNTKAARQVIEAFNTGDLSNVSDFISPKYFNLK